MAEKKYTKASARRAMMDMVMRFGKDGFCNPAASIGMASPLFSSGTFIRSNLTADKDLLTRAYRENWLAKRIIDTPAEDMTRAWYSLSTSSVSKEQLDALAQIEAQHSIKQEITNAIRWAFLYGGSLALICTLSHRIDKPLDMNIMFPGVFTGLLVIDQTMGVTPSTELVSDMFDPDYGLPEYYTMNIEGVGLQKIHHSRVLRFTGRELPCAEANRESFWGASELEHVWDQIITLNSVEANIAELVFRANLTALKMNDIMEMLSLGTDEKNEEVLRMLEMDNRLRTSYGIQLLGENDTMETFNYNFAGLPEVFEQFMINVSGAAEIPATKLFGRSPQGMNATGESDMQNYYERIRSLQERMLRPALEKLLPVLLTQVGVDEKPADMKILFEPIRTMSLEERTKLAGDHTRFVMEAYEKGLITREEAREELKKMSGRTDVWSILNDGEEKK